MTPTSTVPQLDMAFVSQSAMSSKYLPSRIQAWVTLSTYDDNQTIDGLTDIPVNNLMLQFPMGGVGTADFILAVGYNVTSRKLANITETLANLENRFRVSCWMRIEGQESPRNKWPTTKFRVWDGLSLGMGVTRSRDMTSLTLHSAHWILELDSSTVALEAIVKNSATNLLTSVGYQSTGGSVFTGANAIMSLGSGKLPGQLWEAVCKPMLKAVMKSSDESDDQGRLKSQNWHVAINDLNLCRLPGDTSNADIKIGNARGLELLDKKFAKPLERKSLIGGDLNFTSAFYANNIIQAAALYIADNIGVSSCFEKLSLLASTFQWQMLSNVEDVTMAPHIPVMHSSNVWRTIYPSEYVGLRAQGYTPRRIAGVGLVGSNWIRDSMGARPGDPSMIQMGHLIGAFRKSGDGQFILMNAPGWMKFTSKPPEVNNIFNNRRTAADPNGNNPTNPLDTASDVLESKTVGCEIARKIWFDESYAHRAAEVTGRLRFDIMPGSNIRLLVNGPSLTQGSGGINSLMTTLYANVASVSIMVDCNDPRAHTVLALTHLRSSEEKDLANTTHPLYPTTAWYGSPLVKLRDSDLLATP